MNASQILKLIAGRHTDDVFVPECKNGPTQGTSHLRLDAWAMRRSYSRPCMTGYEIKVSRSDFLGDNKSHEYLRYCNEFYFVIPSDTKTPIISPAELPEGAGLMRATDKRINVVVKAPHREVAMPEELYHYVLMSRCTIKDRHFVESVDADTAREKRMASIESYTIRRRHRTALAALIGKRVQQMVVEYETRIQRLTRIRQYNQKLEMLLKRMGYDPEQLGDDGWNLEWTFKAKIATLTGELDDVRDAAVHLADNATRLAGKIDELKCTGKIG